MLLNSFRDGSRSRYVIFQLPNNYFISFKILTVFGAICTALNFTSMLKVYSSNKENVTKCYGKYTSIQCQHSRTVNFFAKNRVSGKYGEIQ